MNKIVSSDQMAVSLQDVSQVAGIAMRQLAQIPEDSRRSVADLFLNEPFVLGYAIGFAEQACWHMHNGNGEEMCSDYLQDVIGNMLGDACIAASFVSFAASKQGDRVFEGGYDAGMSDLDAWYLSRGEHMPVGLLRYLQDDPGRR